VNSLSHWSLLLAFFPVVSVACRSAVERELPMPAAAKWESETVVTSAATPGRLLGPVAVLPWGRDSFVISDAIAGRLMLLTLPGPRVIPIGERRYRPAPPTQLDRVGSDEILAGRPRELELVRLANGERRAVSIPVAGWGERRVGRYKVAVDGTVVMAPWSGASWEPSLAPPDSASAELLRFETWTGALVSRFGPPVKEHGVRYGASIEARLAVAGWYRDSLVAVHLFDGRVSIYAPRPTSGSRPVREFRLPRGFEPRPTFEEPVPSPNVVAQSQLRDAVVSAEGDLVVLRNRTYRWANWNPSSRIPGRWLSEMVIELYDLSGRRRRAAGLRGMQWTSGGLAIDHGVRAVYAFNPGTGDSDTVAVLVRYAIH